MTRFDANSTSDEVIQGIDLSGKTVLITGASGGIGLESARVLAQAGATVVIAARDRAKTLNAMDTIRSTHPAAKLDAVELDLGDLNSVRRCAEAVLQSHPKIDIFIANAGIMACPLERTAQGCELQFGTNHIGHFLLTNLLMPAIQRGTHSRVVIVGSAGHRFSDVDFNDPHFEHKPYDRWLAYGQSKTANCLFAVALAQRLAPLGVTANVVHPGRIHTELLRHINAEEQAAVSRTAPSATPPKTVPQGAATQVWAATSPELAGVSGRYLLDCSVGAPNSYHAYALDPANAERLWALSEQVVGQTFPYA